jgi:hypothetical protein
LSNSDIQTAIDDYFDLFVSDGDQAGRLERLIAVLDRLAVLSQSAPAPNAGADDDAEPARFDYQEARRIAERAFPSLGYYNVALEISGRIAQTELAVADAIDDLADILCELQAISWHLGNTSKEDALAAFVFSFRAHWGAHLRSLQLYLHEHYRPDR